MGRDVQIVQFYGAVIEHKSLLLVTEFMPRGSLFKAIGLDREGNLRWHKR